MKSNDSKLIKKNYLKKINLINKYNKAYYKNSNPIVDDFKYDNLKLEILDLEKKYKFLKSDKSPSLIVGFKPSKNFKKVKHKKPMLSLGNAFNKEDLSEIISQTYVKFKNDKIAPLHKLDKNKFLLELFYGPTYAFKDYALQFLGNLFSYSLKKYVCTKF